MLFSCTDPSKGLMPARIFISVVLPDPLFPFSQNEPVGMLREGIWRMIRVLYAFFRSVIWSIVITCWIVRKLFEIGCSIRVPVQWLMQSVRVDINYRVQRVGTRSDLRWRVPKTFDFWGKTTQPWETNQRIAIPLKDTLFRLRKNKLIPLCVPWAEQIQLKSPVLSLWN